MVSIHEVRYKTANITSNNLVVCKSFVLWSCRMGKKATLGTHSWKWGLVCLGLFIFGCELSLAHAGLKTCTVAEDDLELTITLPPRPECWDYSCVLPHQFIWRQGSSLGFPVCTCQAVTLATEPNPQPAFCFHPALLHPTQWPSHSDTNGHAGFDEALASYSCSSSC